MWKTGKSESVVFGLGRSALLEKTEAKGVCESPELVEDCLLWGRGSGWTDCRCWRDTGEVNNSGAGLEVVAEEAEVLAQGRTEE